MIARPRYAWRASGGVTIADGTPDCDAAETTARPSATTNAGWKQEVREDTRTLDAPSSAHPLTKRRGPDQDLPRLRFVAPDDLRAVLRAVFRAAGRLVLRAVLRAVFRAVLRAV